MSATNLVYSSDAEPGIQRRRHGKWFSYRRDDGSPVREADELQRIRKLAIPPAYDEVWICPLANGHLQATGRDARGRKQYRYHDQWRNARDADKFERLKQFAQALPRIRRHVARELRQTQHGRAQLLAALVQLLDTTMARIGNDAYARENGSYGLTTLRKRHLRIHGGLLKLRFQGKSGVTQQLEVSDARLARIVQRCRNLPGQTLFRYQDAAGQVRSIDSTEVNDYLRTITGQQISAKDFRTWHASVLALQACNQALRCPNQAFSLKLMLTEVAGALGNTPAVCRKSYVHSQVLAFAAEVSARPAQAAELLQHAAQHLPQASSGLRRAEQRLMGFLEAMPCKDTVRQ